MMKLRLIGAVIALIAASPAIAAGGMTCRTAGARPVQIDLTYGHVFGTPLVASRVTHTSFPSCRARFIGGVIKLMGEYLPNDIVHVAPARIPS